MKFNAVNVKSMSRITKFQLENRLPYEEEYDLHLPTKPVVALTPVEVPQAYILPGVPHGVPVRAKDIDAARSAAPDSMKDEMNEQLGSSGDHIKETRFPSQPLQRFTWPGKGAGTRVRSKSRPLRDESSMLLLPLSLPGGRPGTAQGKFYLLLLPMTWGVCTPAVLVERVNILLPWGAPIILGALSSATLLKIVPMLFPELPQKVSRKDIYTPVHHVERCRLVYI